MSKNCLYESFIKWVNYRIVYIIMYLVNMLYLGNFFYMIGCKFLIIKIKDNLRF